MSTLERIAVAVPEAGVEAFTAALESACLAVGLFHDEDAGLWACGHLAITRRLKPRSRWPPWPPVSPRPR